MKIWEQIREVIGKEAGQPSGNFYRKLMLLLLLGIGLLGLSSWLGSGKKNQVLPEDPAPGSIQLEQQPVEQLLVRELEDMIGQIKGVGRVNIFLTLEAGNRKELVTDEERTNRQTQEGDSGGGSREIIEETTRDTYVILRDGQGREQPLVIQELQPCYRGVLVVAEGVEDPAVKEQVVEALKAVLNLSSHRITVLPRGR